MPDPGTPLTDRPADASAATLLLVDDEPTIRLLAAVMLGERGYVVLEAEDAASGLALLRSGRRIDLLVTDLGLPGGMDGRQLAAAARDAQPGLAVLFITGQPQGLEHDAAPVEHMLHKPFTMRTLVRQVQALLPLD